MPRFAANLTMMFNEVPFLERFAAAREAGFDAVEFLFPYDHPVEEVRRCAVEAGTEIVLFNMPPGNWGAGERGIAALPERAGEFTQGLATALRYAQILEVRLMHMMAAIAPSGEAASRERYLDALREAADAANPLGVDILIEPINGRDMPSYFLNDFAMAAEFIDRSGRSNVKLQYDIYHRQILHGDVVRSLEALLPIIGHVQIAAVPLRHEPGTGELNDAAIFRLLDDVGYRGSVGCEYRPRGRTSAGLSWMTL